MSILKFLTDIFDSLFRSSSPEVQTKMKLKKIDSELKNLQSGIYKNGLIQPNFAEVLRILYVNTREISKILETTIAGPDIKRNTRFEFQLIVSCYSEENQQRLKELEYEKRKTEVTLADLDSKNVSKTFEDQRRSLEKLVHELNSKEMMQIDFILIKLKQLVELCRFNFVTPLKTFDPKFNQNDAHYVPAFSAVAPISLENVLLDLYYIVADFSLTMPVAEAVIALSQILHNNSVSENKQKEIINSLKKVEYACHKIFTEDSLKKLIQLSKQNPEFEPQRAAFSADSRQRFSAYLQDTFNSEESRIKRELKDSRIKSDLHNLFEDRPLLELLGYNENLNSLLMQNSSASFSWITPIQVLKTFSQVFYSTQVQSLLNDIVIEGFFNNPNYKSQFSQTVFGANEIEEKIKAFEKSFESKGQNSEVLIKSYIKDSHKDSDFSKKLITHVDNINQEAKQIIQAQVNVLHSLYIELGDLLQDSKKPSCEIISNLKVLLISSRNRDTTNFLENNYEKWHIFFEIMKNYAIIATTEKK